MVGSPTHLKNMRKSNWIISPTKGENNKNETTTVSHKSPQKSGCQMGKQKPWNLLALRLSNLSNNSLLKGIPSGNLWYIYRKSWCLLLQSTFPCGSNIKTKKNMKGVFSLNFWSILKSSAMKWLEKLRPFVDSQCKLNQTWRPVADNIVL